MFVWSFEIWFLLVQQSNPLILKKTNSRLSYEKGHEVGQIIKTI